MNRNERHYSCQTKSKLGRLYCQHYARVVQEMQPKLMGHVSIEVLEGIESFAVENLESSVVQMHKDMLRAIRSDIPVGDPQAITRFSTLYKGASDIVFPATSAFLTVCNSVNKRSSSYSLSVIDLDTLRAIDLKAHSDPVLNTLRNNLESRLEKISDIDDVTAYSQVCEIYGEIVAYLFLHKLVSTERLPERKRQKTPDFRCELLKGKLFHVEVKTFGIVGGDTRKQEMMENSLDTKIELENQLQAGKPVASAITENAPFRKAGETETYDPSSLIRVIDTLRKKSVQNFKPGQFKDGPTFALVIADRLVLPGGKYDLAPYYYYADFNDGGITSGVLWHMAYGHPGTPIFQLPDFAGAKCLEGHLENYGLFVDNDHPFPGPGLIVLYREQGERRALGLVNHAFPADEHWSIDDTHAVLSKLCDHWNDEGASRLTSAVYERK